MNNPLVSIIIPFFNSSKFISKTIQSISNQTLRNWEAIFINDASTDNSPIIVRDFCHHERRARLINLQTNSGPALARNKGISKASGRYIAFIDSDDVWAPTKLETQVLFMQNHNLPLTYSSYLIIDSNENILHTHTAKAKITYHDLLKSNQIGNLTGIYDSFILGKVYLENTKHEDYTLWLKILKQVGHAKGIQSPLAKYRIHQNNLSSNKIKTLKWQWLIYKNIAKLNFIQRIFYISFYGYYGFKKNFQMWINHP